jgi:hypothetical protein
MLSIFSFVYFSLSLFLAMIATSITALGWWTLFIQKIKECRGTL